MREWPFLADPGGDRFRFCVWVPFRHCIRQLRSMTEPDEIDIKTIPRQVNPTLSCELRFVFAVCAGTNDPNRHHYLHIPESPVIMKDNIGLMEHSAGWQLKAGRTFKNHGAQAAGNSLALDPIPYGM